MQKWMLAAAMLRALGIDKVRLLTNNAAKVTGLTAAGVEVVERVAHLLRRRGRGSGQVQSRGTGRVISALGGTPEPVTCPWCEGSGRFRRGSRWRDPARRARSRRPSGRAVRSGARRGIPPP